MSARVLPPHWFLSSPEEFAFHRASTTPDYFRWLDHVASAAGCSHPIRLVGRIDTVDTETGTTLTSLSTDNLPDRAIYKNCGNRRAAVCPSCSTTYRRDAYQLIRAGLVGGKGIPPSVSTHAAVFATFTAPGFGPVHTRRTSSSGKAIPCRPRRGEDLCPHGVDLRCDRIHHQDEKSLGLPFCLGCYDHAHQVVWNNAAGELWRRTRINMDRAITRTAKQRGIDPKGIRVSYGKVAEMQRRGVVHFHVIIRLDGVDPTNPDAIVPPPDGIGLLDLVAAIEHAAADTRFSTPPHHRHPTGWVIAWGEQLDIRPVRVSGHREISDEMVAGYLAKYATKSTESAGHVSSRLTHESIDLYANPQGTHVERLIDACWRIGGYNPGLSLLDQADRPYGGLRRWAHMLGFGGHFLTKSRRYSITFRILRENRVVWRRTTTEDLDSEHQEQTTLLIATLIYAGSGWRTHGDALLANTSAALARERRRIGRIESTSLN
jgi:hypothetical protein